MAKQKIQLYFAHNAKYPKCIHTPVISAMCILQAHIFINENCYFAYIGMQRCDTDAINDELRKTLICSWDLDAEHKL